MILDIFSLKEKVAIVTGAGRGIGRSIAMGLAEAGATVIVASRTKEQIEDTASAITLKGGNSLAITADVRSKEKIEYLVNMALTNYGKIDILVNNAGGMFSVNTMKMSENQWDVIISENLKSVFLCSQTVGKIMINQKSGSIINIASIVGVVAQPLNAAYAASKAGVINLTKTMAIDLAPYGIRVNGIAPGLIITPGTEWLYQDPENMSQAIPLARGGRPEDIVGGVIYLASDASQYVTGETIVIDGGLLIKPPINQAKLQ